MRYTKEMQVGKKQRRKKHKPSIIQRKDGRCYLCMLLNEDNGAKKTQEHHIFGGSNRDHSEETGLKVHLCLEHHTAGKLAFTDAGIPEGFWSEPHREYLRKHTVEKNL